MPFCWWTCLGRSSVGGKRKLTEGGRNEIGVKCYMTIRGENTPRQGERNEVDEMMVVGEVQFGDDKPDVSTVCTIIKSFW